MKPVKLVAVGLVLTIGAATLAHAQSPRLSVVQVVRGGTGGPVCGFIKARSDSAVSNGRYNLIVKQACFRSRAQCRNWLYWAQTYFGRVMSRRTCR